mmetsp:Transcript_18193/g.18245  ORF Transcript_18193/g.18245 Transcript_18193/m.18245 type:complete len:187 (+) Transcript_18193:26-586(+)
MLTVGIMSAAGYVDSIASVASDDRMLGSATFLRFLKNHQVDYSAMEKDFRVEYRAVDHAGYPQTLFGKSHTEGWRTDDTGTRCTPDIGLDNRENPDESRDNDSDPVETSGSKTGGNEKSAAEKSYSCNRCSSSFRRKPDLKRHVNSVHKGLRPYICKTCSKTFTTSGNMRKHTRKLHYNEPVEVRV